MFVVRFMDVLHGLYRHDALLSSYSDVLPALALLKQQALRVLQDCSHEDGLAICSRYLAQHQLSYIGADSSIDTGDFVSVLGKQILEDIATIRRIGRVPIPDSTPASFSPPIQAHELLPTSKLCFLANNPS
jgi:hypothetical protein